MKASATTLTSNSSSRKRKTDSEHCHDNPNDIWRADVNSVLLNGARSFVLPLYTKHNHHGNANVY